MKPWKMNKDYLDKWIAALESGEYFQEKGQLRVGDGFCCLGVLCDILAKEGVGTWGNPGGTFYSKGSKSLNTLPHTVVSHIKLELQGKFISPVIPNNPTIQDNESVEHSLAYLNDKGTSFQEIANLIKENFEGVE